MKIMHCWLVSSLASFFWINMLAKPALKLAGTDADLVNRIAFFGMCYLLISAWLMVSDLRNFATPQTAPIKSYLKAGLIAPFYLPLVRRTVRD